MTIDSLICDDSAGDEFLRNKLGEDAKSYLSDKINQTVSEEIIEQLKIKKCEKTNPLLERNLQEFQKDCKGSAYDPEKYSLVKQENAIRIYQKDSGESVAYIEYTLNHPNFLGDVFVQSGEVEPEERKNGLMTRLCVALEQEAIKKDTKRIYTDVDADNIEMQSILMSLGYELLGKEEYESSNIDRYLWAKEL